jgi:hypothetical protein
MGKGRGVPRPWWRLARVVVTCTLLLIMTVLRALTIGPPGRDMAIAVTAIVVSLSGIVIYKEYRR